jgi:hypothetical protein
MATVQKLGKENRGGASGASMHVIAHLGSALMQRPLVRLRLHGLTIKRSDCAPKGTNVRTRWVRTSRG